MVRQLALFEKRTPRGPRRGRPPGPSPKVRHRRRPPVSSAHPHHVTLRMRDHVWNLRSQRSFKRIAGALAAVREREGFRVVHFSVQGNHVHLLTEAGSRAAMSNGMRALLIRIARSLNAMMRTRGRVFADRYHESIVRSPNRARNVLRYVLGNHTHHHGQRGADVFSSAVASHLVVDPESWLLRKGWARAGP